MSFQEDVLSHDQVQEWMKQVHPTTSSVRIQDKMLDQEKEASVTMTATPKRLQVLLCNRLRELEDDYEINGSVAGKVTAIPRLSIY
jgi:hypothetical protein